MESNSSDRKRWEEKHISRDSGEMSSDLTETILNVSEYIPDFSKIQALKQPWKWEEIREYFALVESYLTTGDTKRTDFDFSLRVVECFMECLNVCNDGDKCEPYDYLSNLITYLPVNVNLVFRLLYFFCFRVTLVNTIPAIPRFLHNVSERLLINDLCTIDDNLLKDEVAQQEGGKRVISLLEENINKRIQLKMKELEEFVKHYKPELQDKKDYFRKLHKTLLDVPILTTNEVLEFCLEQLKANNNTDVVTLCLRCIQRAIGLIQSLDSKLVSKLIQPCIQKFNAALNLSVRNEVSKVFTAIVQKSPTSFKEILKPMLHKLQPDKQAKEFLQNNVGNVGNVGNTGNPNSACATSCACYIQWIHQHVDKVSQLDTSTTNSVLSEVLPLYIPANQSLFPLLTTIVNQLKYKDKEFLNILKKQKSDTIRIIADIFKWVTKDTLLRQHIEATSPRPKTPYRRDSGTPRIFYNGNNGTPRNLFSGNNGTPRNLFSGNSGTPRNLYRRGSQNVFTFDNVLENPKSSQISERNAREKKWSLDFTKLASSREVKELSKNSIPGEYINRLFPDVSSRGSIDQNLLPLFISCINRNEGLNGTPLLHNLDVFILFFCHRLLQPSLSADEQEFILDCVRALCNWCASQDPCVVFTKLEVKTILLSLFFRNKTGEMNHLIEEVLSHSKQDEIVIIFGKLLSRHLQNTNLSNQNQEINTAILLGIIKFLSTWVNHDPFCNQSISKLAHLIIDIMSYPIEEVNKEGESLIHSFCRAGYSISDSSDLRVKILNLCMKSNKQYLPKDISNYSEMRPPLDTSYSSVETGSGLSSPDSGYGFESTPNPNPVFVSVSRRTIVSKDVDGNQQNSNLNGESDPISKNDEADPISTNDESDPSLTDSDFDQFGNENKFVSNIKSTNKDDSIFIRYSQMAENKNESSLYIETQSPNKQKLYSTCCILNVTVTLYQGVPYTTVISRHYSKLYEHLLESFNYLDHFVKETNDIEVIYDYNNDILSALFKLFQLCLKQYIQLPNKISSAQKEIENLQNSIQDHRSEYIRTRSKDTKDKAIENRKDMIRHSVCLELDKQESKELDGFLEKLVKPISAILQSPYLDDICSNISEITMFYILSVYFLSLESDVCRHYSEPIRSFFVEIIIQSDPYSLFTCLIDYIYIYGMRDGVQQWNEVCINAAVELLNLIHQNNINKQNLYVGVSVRKIRKQMRILLNKQLVEPLRYAIYDIYNSLCTIIDTSNGNNYNSSQNRPTEFSELNP